MEQEHISNLFPCTSLPEDPATGRLLGLYPQRQEGLWMQRVRVPGGRLSAAQWRMLAQIVHRFTPAEPLHLTTRQDVEIHGLTATAVPQAQGLVAEAGLTGWGACGDTIRNVTVCPCSGLAADAPDLLPLAGQLTELLQSQRGAFSLPRKLKISFSACREGCGQPWLNDLGFVAIPDGGGWKFQAVLAGSLGAKPASGIAYKKPLDAGEALPLSLAAFRVFAAHGDREHRNKARLRHVRQRLGDAAFLELLERELAEVRKERVWPDIPLAGPESGFAGKRLLHFDDGNLAVQTVEALGSLADRPDLRVRIGNQHVVAIFGRDEPALDAALTELKLDNFAVPGPRVVVCPGARWCSRGLADTGRLAKAVRQRLNGSNAGNVLIAISGCPNGCAHSAVADVGAIGLAATVEGARTEAWNIFSGGQRGLGPGLAGQTDTRLALDAAAIKIIELAAACRAASAGGAGR
ncbi:MAG: nitrite/sulfite reductase [Planctomycetes bacterium]|nr:nitrite/sulfite reductase [Planctomycetota bacterium]